MGKLQRNLTSLFIIVIVFLTIILITTYYIGNKQDFIAYEDQQKFKYVVSLLYDQEISDQKLDEASLLLNDLEQRHPNNPLVLLNKGWAYNMKQEYQRALDYYIVAQDMNPVLSRQPSFLLQVGQALMNLERFEEAVIYLEHTKKQSGVTEEQIKVINSWLKIAEQRLINS